MKTRADIICRLQKDILALQGFQEQVRVEEDLFRLGVINASFPNHVFPQNALHEFICTCKEERSASAGFLTALLSPLMRRGGVVLWAGLRQEIFPPALKAFGIVPDQVIFVPLKKENDVAWVM